MTAAGGPDRDETEAFPARRERLAVTVRPARPDDLAACAVVFRTAINDYTRRLGQIDVPEDPGPVTRLWTHTRSTDPERFVVATAANGGDGAGSERIVAFGSAVLRERLWFLSMLFVLPEAQRSAADTTAARKTRRRSSTRFPTTMRAAAAAKTC